MRIAINIKSIGYDHEIASAQLVTGSVVIAVDFFKLILAGLRNIFGGRISSFEPLIDRARREAILKMKEQAAQLHAHMIVNLRFETSSIGQGSRRRKATHSVEVLAYGTAITFNDVERIKA